MLIEPTAHLHGDGTGDPAAHCERLAITAQRGSEPRRLATMTRVLARPESRERLWDLVEQLDAQVEAELAAGGAYDEPHDCDAEPAADACPHCGAARHLAESLGY